MSLSYISNNRRARRRNAPKDFGVNSCGGDVLGQIHEDLGLPVHQDRGWRVHGREAPFRVPFSATAAEAWEWGDKISEISDRHLVRLLKNPEKYGYGWGGSQKGFVEFVREWQEFLKTCGGYKCL
jgi:hypothetical protein